LCALCTCTDNEGTGVDGQRFDDLTRLVAAGVPRRKMLGLIGGGLAALTGRKVGRAQDVCLEIGMNCVESVASCCGDLVCDANGTGVCIPAIPICAAEGDSCALITGRLLGCCDGLVCADGICVAPDPICAAEGETCGVIAPAGAPVIECCDGLVCSDAGICEVPAPVCAAEGEACAMIDGGPSACCDGLVCSTDGTCVVPGPICSAEGETCEGDSDCCDGICCNGACRAIECCIDDPNPNARCGDGQTCQEGTCETVGGVGCANDSDCAGDTCCCGDGTCSVDCCDPKEPVTQLPVTGSGSGQDLASGWLGAAVGGAAAAFLGGKVLRDQKNATETAE
jgi:hypothetical protein